MKLLLSLLLCFALPAFASNFTLINSSTCTISGTPLVQFRIPPSQTWQNSASLSGCSGMGIGTCNTSFGGPTAFDGVICRIVYYMNGAGAGCPALYTDEVTGGANMTFTLNGSGCSACFSNAPTCYTNSYSVYNGDPVSHSFGFYNNGVLAAYFVVGAGKTAGTSIAWCNPGGTMPDVKTVCFDCDGTSAPATPPSLLSDVGDPTFNVSSNGTTTVTTSVPGVDGSSLTNITFGGSSAALTEGTFKSGIQSLYNQAGAVGAKLDADLVAANSHLLDVNQGIDLSNVKLDSIDTSVDSVGSSVVSAVNTASSTQHTDSVAEKTATDAVKTAVDSVKSVADEQKALLVTIAANTTVSNAAPFMPELPAMSTNAQLAMAWAEGQLGTTPGKFDSVVESLTPPDIGTIPHPSMTIPFAGTTLDLDPAVRFPGLSEFLHAMFKLMLSLWLAYELVKLCWDVVTEYWKVPGIPVSNISQPLFSQYFNLWAVGVSLLGVGATVMLWDAVSEWVLDYIINHTNIWIHLQTIAGANPIAVYLIFYCFPVEFAIDCVAAYLIARTMVSKLYLLAMTASRVVARF